MAQIGSAYISNASLVVGAMSAEMRSISSADISAGSSSSSPSFAEYGKLFAQANQSRGVSLALIALVVLPPLLVGIVPAVDLFVGAIASLLQQLKVTEFALDSIALFLCGAHLVWCAIEHSLTSRT